MTEKSIIIIGAGLAADSGCGHDRYREDPAGPGQFLYGWPMGDARWRCPSLPLFRPPRGTDPLPPRREAIFDDLAVTFKVVIAVLWQELWMGHALS